MKKIDKEHPDTIRSLQADIKALREEVEELIETRQELRNKLVDLTNKSNCQAYQLAIIREVMRGEWK